MTNEEIEEIAKKQLDAAGWSKKQYNVRIPPARPDEHNKELTGRAKPIPGAAFPS